jgi:cytochrome c oxidase subunit 3
VSLSYAIAGLLAGILVWALLVSRLSGKSWQVKDAIGALREGGGTSLPPARIGFWMLLGVISALFGLFITAYHMRMVDGMQHGDWCHYPVPGLLWFNTLVLMLGSVAMQSARAAADRDARQQLRLRLVTGGLLTLAFLVGQLLAWRELSSTSFYSLRNPAVAFFYLLTAVHGLHLVGGLVVWARTVGRLLAPAARSPDVRETVALCTVYWHYLLLVWLVLFGLLLST